MYLVSCESEVIHTAGTESQQNIDKFAVAKRRSHNLPVNLQLRQHTGKNGLVSRSTVGRSCDQVVSETNDSESKYEKPCMVSRKTYGLQ